MYFNKSKIILITKEKKIVILQMMGKKRKMLGFKKTYKLWTLMKVRLTIIMMGSEWLMTAVGNQLN